MTTLLRSAQFSAVFLWLLVFKDIPPVSCPAWVLSLCVIYLCMLEFKSRQGQSCWFALSSREIKWLVKDMPSQKDSSQQVHIGVATVSNYEEHHCKFLLNWDSHNFKIKVWGVFCLFLVFCLFGFLIVLVLTLKLWKPKRFHVLVLKVL